jgi:trans-aconitate methyltransferase
MKENENTIIKKWDSELYSQKHSYVFKYGEDLLNLLQTKLGERILDLGCGTGHLTNLIAESGADVIGIDSSKEMIDLARQNYPGINFELMDATNFSFNEKFDAVFSNAVLHWILQKENVVDCVYDNLKNGGRFILEMGGKDNIKRVINALRKILSENGFKSNSEIEMWYFPSVGEYSSLLEKKGFRITYAAHFDRDTFLNENDTIEDWLEMFAKNFFDGINLNEKKKLHKLISNELYKTNVKEGKWFIDYKRLRIAAIKG